MTTTHVRNSILGTCLPGTQGNRSTLPLYLEFREVASMAGLGFIICCVIAVIGFHGSGCWMPVAFVDASEEHHQWKALTQENFTLVRHRGFSLCISMLSWCGEGRSLMGELSRLLEKDRGAFSTLNLRYVYIDKDRPLAQIVPTKRSPTIYLFRHGIPYLYGGRLTGSHILEGTKHGMRTKGFPLELLQTTEALKSFVDSTDRAFLLLDFCGFAQTIVQKHLQSKGLLVGANTMALENEGVDHATSDRQHDERSDAVEGVGGNGNLPEVSFQYHEPLLEKLFEGLENSSRDTSMELTMRSRSWDEHFISSILPGVANSTSGPTANVGHESSSFSEDDGSMCTTLEKERFDAVFDNFSKVAIRNALTPHRAKFGIVTIESVAVDVGLVELGSRPWKLVAKAQDPHRVPDEFDIEKGVESFVSSVSPTLVKELELEGYQQHASASSAFLNDTLSLLLFIDRGSSSPQVRSLSQVALEATRGVALHYAAMADAEMKAQGVSPAQEAKISPKREMTSDEYLEASIPAGLGQQWHVQVLADLLKDATNYLDFLKRVKSGALQLQPENGNLIFKLKVQGLESSTKLQSQGPGHVDQHTLAGREESRGPRSVFDIIKSLLKFGAVPPSERAVSGDLNESDSPLKDVVKDVDTDAPEIPGGLQSTATSEGEILDKQCSLDNSGFCGSNEGGVEIEGGEEEGGSLMSSDLNVDTTEGLPWPTDIAQFLDTSAGEKAEDRSALITRMKDMLPLDSEHVKGPSQNPMVGPGVGVSPEDNWKDHRSESVLDYADDEHVLEAGETLDNEIKKPGDEELGNNAVQKLLIGGAQEGVEAYRKARPHIDFLFRDGDDLLKEKLTRSTVTPSVVILHPDRAAHYVFPVDERIDETSLIHFIDRFFLGQLEETVRSEPPPGPQRAGPCPPFVNRDFHDFNSVPRVTADVFYSQVLGIHGTKSFTGATPSTKTGKCGEVNVGGLMGPAQWKDVVVLFTAPYCGFCKRLELVFREVYRSLSLHTGSCSGRRHSEGSLHEKHWDLGDANCLDAEEVTQREASNSKSDCSHGLPRLLQMDCTLNDCDFFLRDLINPDETYPALVLYPAQQKQAPVVYEGAPEFQSLHHFISTHGRASSKLLSKISVGHSPIIKRTFLTSISASSLRREKLSTHDLSAVEPDPLQTVLTTRASSTHQVDSKEVMVGSLLIASGRLDGASPVFQSSIILIIHADPREDVRGLILNKPLSWKNVQNLHIELPERFKAVPVCYGGPVSGEGQLLSVITRVPGLEKFEEVMPGFFSRLGTKSRNVFQIMESVKLTPEDVWLFLGFASWSWNQLQMELAEEFWHVEQYRDGIVQWPPYPAR